MAIDTRTGRRRLWVVWPIAAAATWLGSMGWIANQIGISGMASGLVLSAAITVVIILTFLWLDRWTRGRSGLLVSAFVWGASVATFGAIWSQQWLHALVDAIWGTDVGAWVRPLIITPVTEEVLKGLFLIWLLVHRRREITGVLDAIVYAGLVGVGFSFTENSLYLGGPLSDVVETGATDAAAISVLSVALFMRVLLVPFFHSVMVVLTGIGVGLAANSRGRGGRALPVALGLLTAIVLHGIWDWAGLVSSDPFLLFKIYGVVMIPVFVTLVTFSIVLRHRTARTITAGIPILIGKGDVASEEAAPLTSLRARRRWRTEVRGSSGIPAARALGRYQSEVSALAIRAARDNAEDRQQFAEQRRITAEAKSSADPTGVLASIGSRGSLSGSIDESTP